MQILETASSYNLRLSSSLPLGCHSNKDFFPEFCMDFLNMSSLMQLKRLKLRKNNWECETYEFDDVLNEFSSQKKVYEVVAKPVVEVVTLLLPFIWFYGDFFMCFLARGLNFLYDGLCDTLLHFFN
jgi:hypothetical protein